MTHHRELHIQFLWWEECESHGEAWRRLQAVLDAVGVPAHVERIEVRTDAEAERWHFPGSPTIRINGEDIDPARAEAPSRLTCRLYRREDGRPSPLPTEDAIRRAVERALTNT